MTKTEIKLTVLEASENHFITQISEVAPEERVFAKKVYLSVLDSPDNYREVSEAEKAIILNNTESND